MAAGQGELGADNRATPSEGAPEADAQSAGGLSRICALVIIGLCVAVSFEAFRLDAWTSDGAGPGLLPQILLPLIALAALTIVFSPGNPPIEGEAGPVLKNGNFLAYAIGMVGTAAAVPYLGLMLAGFVAVLIIMRFGERRSWVASLIWATALVFALTLVFGVLLGVAFPPGPLEHGLTKLGLLRAG